MATQRTSDGQRVRKMLRIANVSNNEKRNTVTAGRMWEEIIKKIDVHQFPSLGPKTE